MAVLIWNHGQNRNAVRQLLQSRMDKAGVSDKVSWKGDVFTASVGWGAILNLVGEITDDTIVLEKSSGALGGVVLAKSREAFQELFPNGEKLNAGSNPGGDAAGRTN